MKISERFKNACTKGNLTRAKIIIFFNPSLKDSNHNRNFLIVCQRGYLAFAQWLVLTIPNIIYSINYDEVFGLTCGAGHLETAKWLYSMKPNPISDKYYQTAFQMAGSQGHLEVAQWLLLMNTCISNVTFDLTFYTARLNGQVTITQWLALIFPRISQTSKQTVKKLNLSVIKLSDNEHVLVNAN